MTIALSLDDHQAVVQLTAAGLYLGRTPPADRGRGAQVIAAETTAQVSSTDGRVTITLRRRGLPLRCLAMKAAMSVQASSFATA